MMTFYTELEALGDDLALDEDTSYLDEVPAPSDTLPGEGDQEGTKTQVQLFIMLKMIVIVFIHSMSVPLLI